MKKIAMAYSIGAGMGLVAGMAVGVGLVATLMLKGGKK